jgi:hypothetical protein
MTHPVHSQTTLEALSTKELKTIASQIGAIPDGDKRVKQTWISAIIDHQTKFSPVKVAAMEAHIETVLNRLEPIPAETEAIDSIQPTDKPIEELATYPIESPTDKPIEEPPLVEHYSYQTTTPFPTGTNRYRNNLRRSRPLHPIGSRSNQISTTHSL